MDESKAHELYRRHRPVKFSEVIDQPEAVSILDEQIKQGRLQRTILLHGPSGTGKTTLARILQRKLGCSDMDFQEINCAIVKEVLEAVRDIQQRMGLYPINGPCRIWFLEEAQALSKAGFAQQALLKMLEDVPHHVYFILATTDPGKLLPAIRTRCLTLALKPLTAKGIMSVLKDALAREKQVVPDKVLNRIVEAAKGSARQALQDLHKVMFLPDEQAQLAAVLDPDGEKQAIDIARALMNPGAKWPDVAALIKEVTDEPETVRRVILAYYESVLLGGGKLAGRAAELINRFRFHFYDSGRPGLSLECYEACKK